MQSIPAVCYTAHIFIYSTATNIIIGTQRNTVLLFYHVIVRAACRTTKRRPK